MSFHILAESITAWANELNDNWRHIAHGEINARLPRGGNSLTVTDAVYDLGGSTTTWNNSFCNTLNINDRITSVDRSQWELIYSENFSEGSQNSTITVTGLNGDDQTEYLFLSYYGATTIGGPFLALYLQTITSGTTWGIQQIIYRAGTLTAERDTISYLPLGFYLKSAGAAGMNKTFCKTLLTGSTKRNVLQEFVVFEDSYTSAWYKAVYTYQNTTETLTGFKIDRGIVTQGKIEIWRKG